MSQKSTKVSNVSISEKPLTISLVIPVYNEESYLGGCLQAVMAQTEAFHEIIVVDNNSTDNTVTIARRFPSVKVLHEPRQGVVFARNRGFTGASGDIIARIDADTVIPANWSQTVRQIFAAATVDAVSGKMEYYDMAAHQVFNRVDLAFRRYFARTLGREVALQGANMAIRRSVWQTVQPELCCGSLMHEDFDLAIHSNWLGFTVQFDERLVASIGYRQAGCSFRAFCTYAALSPGTYLQHGLRRSGRKMYPVVGLVAICYLLLKVLHRGYDAQTESFSWHKLLLPPEAVRVNPATFID